MSLITDCADRKDIFCKIRRRGKSSYFPRQFVLQALFLEWHAPQAPVQNVNPRKAYDPEFHYDFPLSSLFHEDFDLEEKGDTLQHVQSAKQSKTSKSKPPTVPAASPPPIFPEDSASFLTYDQQLQLIQLQKEKLELELKVLSLSHRKRLQEHTLEGFTEEVTSQRASRATTGQEIL